MTDVMITILPAAPLRVLDIWSNPKMVAARFEAALGFALPVLGKSDGNGALLLIRYEPTVWLVEGYSATLSAILAGDGALTAIGGGIVRVQLSGKAWRALLMEGGVFDAEAAAFAPGCSAATVIDHVAIRLHVVSEEACVAYVPASFSSGLIHFWNQAAQTLTN